MKVLAAITVLLVSSAAAAQEECKTCSKAEACITAYHKAAAEAQRVTKQAIRDWKENLDKRPPQSFRTKARSRCKTPWKRKSVRILSG